MPEQDADLVEHFSSMAAAATFSALPAEAVEAAKQSIFDTLGVSLGASGLEHAVSAVTQLARENGGRTEATVIAADLRVPASAAAFVNGAMAHCLDYDDYTHWGHHAGSSIVPAAFAVAEKVGGVSGEEFITAVAVGQDIFGRLRRYVEWEQDWNLSPVMGVFAAAATTARIAGLSQARISHAMGIASMSASGTMEMVRGNSDVRGIYAAFSAQGAVVATSLAAQGLTGLGTLFEGTYGYLNTYFDGKYDRDAILAGLGSDFLGSATLYKRWPSVSTSHSHVHATLQVMSERSLDPRDIAEIKVYVGDWHDVMCSPLEARRAPRTALDGKFSLPYLVATAALRGDIGVLDFTDERLNDPEILALAQKVVPVPDPDLDWKLKIPSGRVEIVLSDGRSVTKEGQNVPGTVEAPLSWDQLRRKFEDCAAAARTPVSTDRLDQVTSTARRLEDVEDATALVRALS